MCSDEGHRGHDNLGSCGSTLHSLVSGRAKAVAVRYDDGEATTLQVTYGELCRQAAQVCAELLELLREDPRPVVGLFTNPVLQLPACILGILQAGAAYVPLNPQGPSKLTAHVMRMTSMQLAYIQVDLIQAFRIQFQEWLEVFCIGGEKSTEDDSKSLGLSLGLVRIEWKETLPTTHMADVQPGDTRENSNHTEAPAHNRDSQRTLCRENSGTRGIGTDCPDSAVYGKVCPDRDSSILGSKQPSVVTEGADEDGKEATCRPDHWKEGGVVGSDAIAYVLHTSGTTGPPKIVHVPHACIVPNITHLRSLFAMSPEDVVVLVSALTFDPSVVELFVALASGATLLLVPPYVRRSPRDLQRVLFQRSRATVLQATPTLLRRFGVAVLRDVVLASASPLRVLALGGEPFPSLSALRTWKSIGNRTRLFNLYGITEVSCWATCHEIPTQHLLPGCEQCAVPVGKPLLGTRVEVRDGAGQVLHHGQGQIYIGGEQRTCLLDGEAELVPGTMRATGDVGRVAGRLVYYVGRSDGLVKRHGQKLDPLLLQQTAECLAAVEACAAVMTPGQTLLLLFVVPAMSPGSRSGSQRDGSCTRGTLPPPSPSPPPPCEPGDRRSERLGEPQFGEWELEDALRGGIMRELASLLPSHARPDSVMLISTLPLTSHGKVSSAELLALYEVENAQISRVGKPWEPDQLKRTLWACWQEALGRGVFAEVADLAATFLRVGGDSLGVVRLSGDVERRLGTSLPGLPDLLLHRTFGWALRYCARELYRLGRLLGDREGATWDHITDEHLLEYSSSGIAENTRHSTNTNSENSGKEPRKILKRKVEGDIPEQEAPEGKRTVMPSEHTSSRHIGRLAHRAQTQQAVSEPPPGDEMVAALSRGSRVTVVGGRACSTSAGWPGCGSTRNRAVVTGTGGVTLTELWKCDTGKCVDASPLLMLRARGTAVAVCVGSHSRRVLCAEWPGGRVLWTAELPDRVESSACLSQCGTLVALGCYDGCVYLLRADSGAVAWAFRTGGPVKSSPALDPVSGALLVGSHDQLLYALRPSDEMCVWRLHCGGGSVFSSPCVSLIPRAAYVGTLGGRLLAVNPDDGAMLWSRDCGKPLFSSPACSCAYVCVGCVDGSLYTFSHVGDKMWQFRTDGPVFSSPCIVGNLLDVVFGSHDGSVYAVSASGELRWKHQLGAPVYATPCTWVCIGHLIAVQPSRSRITCYGGSEDIVHGHNPATDGDRVLKSTSTDVSPTALDFQKDAKSAYTTGTTWQPGTILEDSIGLVKGSEERFPLTGAAVDHNTRKKYAIHCLLQYNTVASTGSFTSHELPPIPIVNPGTSVGLSGPTEVHCQVCPAGFVVAAGTDGLVCVLDEQGNPVCSYRLPGEVFSSPVAWGDCLLVGCRDDYLYCLQICPHPTMELKS
ncbi:beta-alanine-activating enzyme isoform X1 [Lampetra planeri]